MIGGPEFLAPLYKQLLLIPEAMICVPELWLFWHLDLKLSLI
jgi:hypothetical protein